jgi:hypothetical protein
VHKSGASRQSAEYWQLEGRFLRYVYNERHDTYSYRNVCHHANLLPAARSNGITFSRAYPKCPKLQQKSGSALPQTALSDAKGTHQRQDLVQVCSELAWCLAPLHTLRMGCNSVFCPSSLYVQSLLAELVRFCTGHACRSAGQYC